MNIRDAFFRLQNGNDIRGCAIATEKDALTISEDIVLCTSRAFASWLSKSTGKGLQNIKVGVGRDSRITGERFVNAALKGLGEAISYDCSITSTPAMFRSTVMEESSFDGAIMITASHLPYNRNGIKFFTPEGALEKSQLEELLDMAADTARYMGIGDGEELLGEKISVSLPDPSPRRSFDICGTYSRQMQEVIREQTGDMDQPLKGLHIVVDAGNGAAGFFPGNILEPLGAYTSGSLLLEPDGMFPAHVPNPENSSAMKAICEAVQKSGADLGVIFDCDGDRAAVVFEGGIPVNRNELIALLSVIVKDEHPGSVIVTDSVTSDQLKDFLEGELGLEHLRFKRGYKNVINRAKELNSEGRDCELAIETSGHGAFRENCFSDDGAYLCIKIISRLALMKKKGLPLSSLIEKLERPAESMEVRYAIRDDDSDSMDFREYGDRVLEAMRALAEEDERFHIVEPNYEGIRISFDDEQVRGWLLLRKSLHDPVLPMNVESESEGGCRIILSRIEPLMKSFTRLSPE